MSSDCLIVELHASRHSTVANVYNIQIFAVFIAIYAPPNSSVTSFRFLGAERIQHGFT